MDCCFFNDFVVILFLMLFDFALFCLCLCEVWCVMMACFSIQQVREQLCVVHLVRACWTKKPKRSGGRGFKTDQRATSLGDDKAMGQNPGTPVNTQKAF